MRYANQSKISVRVLKGSTPCATHHFPGGSLHAPYDPALLLRGGDRLVRSNVDYYIRQQYESALTLAIAQNDSATAEVVRTCLKLDPPAPAGKSRQNPAAARGEGRQVVPRLRGQRLHFCPPPLSRINSAFFRACPPPLVDKGRWNEEATPTQHLPYKALTTKDRQPGRVNCPRERSQPWPRTCS